MTKSFKLLKKNLKKLMKDRHLNGVRLAENAGIAGASISQILNDVNVNPSLGLMESLAGGLGVSVSELLAGTGEAKDHPIEVCIERALKSLVNVSSVVKKAAKDTAEELATPPPHPDPEGIEEMIQLFRELKSGGLDEGLAVRVAAALDVFEKRRALKKTR